MPKSVTNTTCFLTTSRMLQETMKYYSQGLIHPIRLAGVSSVSTIHDMLRRFQQGNHIGKLVVTLRDEIEGYEFGEGQKVYKGSTMLDPSASYILVGGLGGLGHSVAIWMVQHGAKHLTFFSRSADNRHEDFVRMLESMGCSVRLVSGSVTEMADVERAVEGNPRPLKGLIQMSMVLCDQNFMEMTIEEWKSTIDPKIKGTWNLHEATYARGIELDFFVLFSSLSGIIGQPGQANYAAASTYLDAFVPYRISMGLRCSVIDIGAMEGVGYLLGNENLLRKMQGTGWHTVKEEELLQVLDVALRPPSKATSGPDSAGNMLLGVSPTTALGKLGSSARLRRDIRMAIYHNDRYPVGIDDTAGAKESILYKFLADARADPAILRAPETPALLAREIGKKLFTILLKPEQALDITLSLIELGLDSMIAVEMRAWWRLMFNVNINALEMIAMGSLEGLGRKASEQLAEKYSK